MASPATMFDPSSRPTLGHSIHYMQRLRARRIWRGLAVAIPLLIVATVIVGVLQDGLGVPNPSAVYLVAVVAAAFVGGRTEAILTAIASALLYNWFFTDPRYTFTVSDPATLLAVALLLFVGIVVGQLAALQRERTQDARAREREARALFRVSRALATRDSTNAVLPEILDVLRTQASMQRVWIGLGSDDASERLIADTGGYGKPAAPTFVNVLKRMPGEEPARWVRVHLPGPRRESMAATAYRVRIEAGQIPLRLDLGAPRARRAPAEPDRNTADGRRRRPDWPSLCPRRARSAIAGS